MTNEQYQSIVIEDLKKIISEKNQKINELGEDLLKEIDILCCKIEGLDKKVEELESNNYE